MRRAFHSQMMLRLKGTFRSVAQRSASSAKRPTWLSPIKFQPKEDDRDTHLLMTYQDELLYFLFFPATDRTALFAYLSSFIRFATFLPFEAWRAKRCDVGGSKCLGERWRESD